MNDPGTSPDSHLDSTVHTTSVHPQRRLGGTLCKTALPDPSLRLSWARKHDAIIVAARARCRTVYESREARRSVARAVPASNPQVV